MEQSGRPAGFFGDEIQPEFDSEPAIEKKPGAPAAFVWRGQRFAVARVVKEWHDYGRVQPGFGGPGRGGTAPWGAQSVSRGVGRDYYRVATEAGEIFDIYFDRRPKGKDKKGSWTLDKKIG